MLLYTCTYCELLIMCNYVVCTNRISHILISNDKLFVSQWRRVSVSWWVYPVDYVTLPSTCAWECAAKQSCVCGLRMCVRACVYVVKCGWEGQTDRMCFVNLGAVDSSLCQIQLFTLDERGTSTSIQITEAIYISVTQCDVIFHFSWMFLC